MPKQASEFVNTFFARKRHARGEGLQQQRANFITALNLAETTFSKMMSEAPDIAVIHEDSLHIRRRSVGLPPGDARPTIFTPFFEDKDTGLSLATRQRLYLNPLWRGDFFEPKQDVKDIEGVVIEGYDLLLKTGPAVGDAYASLNASRRGVIEFALGESVVHAQGYNEAADQEVIGFLASVHNGVQGEIASRVA